MNKVNVHKPLVVCITNSVTVNDVANVLTLIGASPIVTNEISEIADLLNLSSCFKTSLYINIGTINKQQMTLIKEAVLLANKKDIPVILDPVGSGATQLRTNFCKQLLQTSQIAIVRGNLSEISSLSPNSESVSKGVDCVEDNITQSKAVCQSVFDAYKSLVVVSGKEDVIYDGVTSITIQGGDYRLPKISGTGCMLTAIIAAYASVYSPAKAASLAAQLIAKSAKMSASKNPKSTSHFKLELFSAIEEVANG